MVLRVGGLAPSPGEVVLGMDEKPNIQALRRVAPTQRMDPGRVERREFEYERKGIVPFLVAFNVYDGTMLGWCLDKNDPAHFLGGYAKSNGATPKPIAFICSGTTVALISLMTPNATSRAIRGYGCSTRPPMLRSSIKRSCCCARSPRSTLTGLIQSFVST